MGVLNYFYFLFGIVLFFAWRLFHLIEYFKLKPYPNPSKTSVIFFIYGCVNVIIFVNMFQNIDLAYGFDYLILVPSILYIIALINFFGESFVSPTKNYLLALCLGVLIGSVAWVSFNFAFTAGGLYKITSYFTLLPALLGCVIGGIGGKLIYAFLLKRRFPDWNEPLWQLKKFWDVTNHSGLLITVIILAFIEATLQLQSNSLFLIFTSF